MLRITKAAWWLAGITVAVGGLVSLFNMVDDQTHVTTPQLPPVVPAPPAKPREPQHLAKQKAAQAPSYRPEQAEQILHKVQRSQTDAKTMYAISVDHAAQFKDCDAIVDTKISPSSTSTNLVMIVYCANRSTYIVNENRLPTEQQ